MCNEVGMSQYARIMSKEPASATIGHIGVAVMEKGGNAARVGGSELITVGVHDRRQDSGRGKPQLHTISVQVTHSSSKSFWNIEIEDT
jgi:hypothetical protein